MGLGYSPQGSGGGGIPVSLLQAKGDLVEGNGVAAYQRLPSKYALGNNFLSVNPDGTLGYVDIIAFLTAAGFGKGSGAVLQFSVPKNIPNFNFGKAVATSQISVPPQSSSIAKTVPFMTSKVMAAVGLSPLAVDGFVSHQQTPPVDTDETTQANSGVTDSVDLMPPALTAAGDGCYIGKATVFSSASCKVTTAGVGTYTLIWKYWNGTAFVPLTIIYKDDDFKSTGLHRCTFVIPADWATVTISGYTLYFIKAESQGGTMTVQCKGAQAWILQ